MATRIRLIAHLWNDGFRLWIRYDDVSNLADAAACQNDLAAWDVRVQFAVASDLQGVRQIDRTIAAGTSHLRVLDTPVDIGSVVAFNCSLVPRS